MSYLHDDVVDEDLRSSRPAHREFTLGTGTILAIFTGLVMLCGAFFGFGYNMGSKARTEATTASAAESTVPAPNFDRFKPSAGSAGANDAPEPKLPAKTAAAMPAYSPVEPPATANVEARRSAAAARTEAPLAAPTAAAAPAVQPTPHTSAAVASTAEATGTFTVQVAAVSHEVDADLMVDALKRKGYAVTARTVPQDKLFHIQVGSFASKREAEAMRQRLLGDGFNAILK